MALAIALFLMFLAVLFAECNGEMLYEKPGHGARAQRIGRCLCFIIGVFGICAARYF